MLSQNQASISGSMDDSKKAGTIASSCIDENPEDKPIRSELNPELDVKCIKKCEI